MLAPPPPHRSIKVVLQPTEHRGKQLLHPQRRGELLHCPSHKGDGGTFLPVARGVAWPLLLWQPLKGQGRGPPHVGTGNTGCSLAVSQVVVPSMGGPMAGPWGRFTPLGTSPSGQIHPQWGGGA